MDARAVRLILVAAMLSGCTSNGSPGAPSPAGGSLTGTWTMEGDAARTWTLTQGGPQAGGPASFSQVDDPNFGAMSGNGGVVGAIALGSFMFAETYESLVIPSRPSPNNCYVDTSGQLAINGNTMTGSYVQTVGCAGVRMSQTTRSLTMQRK